MSEQSPNDTFTALAAEHEPGLREIFSRLNLAYLDIEQVAHQDGSTHDDHELIWVHEFTPQEHKGRPSRTGITVRDGSEILVVHPITPTGPVLFTSPLYINDYRGRESKNISHSLVVATSLEELVLKLHQGQARVTIQDIQK